jgi:hypothetical protein
MDSSIVVLYTSGASEYVNTHSGKAVSLEYHDITGLTIQTVQQYSKISERQSMTILDMLEVSQYDRMDMPYLESASNRLCVFKT